MTIGPRSETRLQPGGTAQIELTHGKTAIVDVADLPLLKDQKWHAACIGGKYWYALSGRGVLMHRLILDAPARVVVDHINHDSLDNRRQNLRLATTAQNIANQRHKRGCSSEYKGVCWSKQNGRWVAHVKVNWKQMYLGSFDDEEAAARAYDAAAAEAFGKFAYLNFPQQDE